MANKNLFNTRTARIPATDTVNEAGGVAYKMGDKAALAQLACTGCLSNTFYARPEDQLDEVLRLALSLEPEFVAKVALYARREGFMKDMPALLAVAVLRKDPALFEKIAPRVIDNGRMVRNLVQIARSGQVDGMKNLPRPARRFLSQWLINRKYGRLFNESVGQSPSIADLIKMVHPKPQNDQQRALFGYLTDRDYDAEKLPAIVREYEAFKAGETTTVPGVEFRLLDSLGLSTTQWGDVAKSMGWHALRMNLNTLNRHGVFKDKAMVKYVADRLRDEEVIKKARVMPYQLLTAYLAIAQDDGLGRSRYGYYYGSGTQTSDMPVEIALAVQDALEIATDNIPAIDVPLIIAPDVSGSMSSPVTGGRGSATTKTTCIHVAALVAAACLRKNPDAKIIAFAHELYNLKLNPRDSIVTNAQKLIACGGGGTNCSLPMEHIVKKGIPVGMLWYVSDNESWMDDHSWSNGRYHYGTRSKGTSAAGLWEQIKRRNKGAKLVLNDIQPYTHTQVKDQKDVYNVGGFSDAVFKFTAKIAESDGSSDHWVDLINKIDLETN
jgi:60 kDa SS-A/Ro ribonucleoprotein